MKTFFHRLCLIPTAATLLFACQKTGNSDTLAVDTANSAIKTQGQVGFCWSYAAIAIVESRYKMRTGKEIDLSEEALGFFHFAEKLQAKMNYNLRYGLTDTVFYKDPTTGMEQTIANGGYLEGGFINAGYGSKGAFQLIDRWGLIPESKWQVKFDDGAELYYKRFELQNKFIQLQKSIMGKQSMVQMNQIFSIVQPTVFPSLPPVDSFDNGSGTMNSVQYAKDIIQFDSNDYYDVIPKTREQLFSALQQVKESLARGLVVGIAISMPSTQAQRVVGTRFVGYGQPFKLDGAHAMVITDFRNKDGTFGPSPDVSKEVSKPLEEALQFRLKNSWGSQSGINEFGQTVKTGFYDMDILYITDVIMSGGLLIFTFAR